MEYGGLSMLLSGTVLMLLLLASNLDYTNPTQVCLIIVQCIFIVKLLYNLIKLIGVEVFYNNYFGAGIGPILFAYLNCDGTESRLADCRTSSSFYFSSHPNDAGVRCQRNVIASRHAIYLTFYT